METRICCKCKLDKELSSEFFAKDKNDKSGFTYQCKVCRSIKQKEWVKNNPEKVKQTNDRNKAKRKTFYTSPKGKESSRRAHLKRKFGITLEDFNKMLQIQDNCCAICGGTETHDKHGVLAVDHCHTTGKIRGLLCFKCNGGLGFFNDNKTSLINAIKYLENYEFNAIN